MSPEQLAGIAARRAARHTRNVALVTEGIKRWHLQNDDVGLTMAEYLVALLEQEGRLG